MPTILTSGVDYAQFFDDLRAVIRHEINQASPTSPAPIAAESEPLLTVKQAAALLDVTVHSVHEWKRKGLIPFVKLGSRTYFKRGELLASLATQQRSLKPSRRG